jgi:hypothetical protein
MGGHDINKIWDRKPITIATPISKFQTPIIVKGINQKME